MNSEAKLPQHHDRVPDRIGHIGIATKQFEEMLDWYTRVFLAKPVHQEDNLTFLSYDEDEHHRIVLLRMPEEAPDKNPAAAGFHHLCHSFDSIENLLGTYERLKQQGIVPLMLINHGVTTSMYYVDPDGNQVEFQRDNYSTTEQCREYFYSDAFKQNPVGQVFDADILLTGIAEGQPFDSVMNEAIAAGDQSLLPAPP